MTADLDPSTTGPPAGPDDPIARLRATEQVLARLTEIVPVGVVQVDPARRIVHQNERAAQLLGRPRGTELGALFSGVVAADRGRLEAALSAVLLRGEDGELEITADRADGRTARCRISLRALDRAGTMTGALVCIDGVTEDTRRRERLAFRATYDELTGCLDRGSALAALDRALTDAAARGGGVAVVHIGLDGFGAVNQALGRRAGDVLLQRIAEQLREVSRSGDVVARMGGDEFLVIARGVHSPGQAVVIGDRVAAALRRKIAKQPTRHAVASIGIAWTPRSATLSPDVLVAQAGVAMQTSKYEGHGRPVLHGSAEWAPDQSSASR